MSNSFFQFKQFTIFQQRCAMKVCTDACLFGALVADNDLPATNCLDIGTGTGLLPLMLAQKNKQVFIDAVEIDTDAAEQAGENFASSPWKDRIHIFNTDILSFSRDKQYDLIISNPPFFEGDLRSSDQSKNDAKHDTSLNLVQLLQVTKQRLTANGTIAVLLPYRRVDFFIEEAGKQELQLTQKLLVKQTSNHDYFRGILFLGRSKTETVSESMYIKDKEGNYTPEFVAALKDYYLYL
jgi:tRNA1Val (adenine37-N6)-methyltransferase